MWTARVRPDRLWFGFALAALFALPPALAVPWPAQPAHAAAVQATVRISGRLTDAGTGSPLSGVYVEAKDENQSFLAWTSSGPDGAYSLTVTPSPLYYVYTDCWVDRGDYLVHGYLPGPVKLTRGDRLDIEADLALRPAGNVILEVYDGVGEANGGQGNQVRAGDFGRMTRDYGFVTGLDDRPCLGGINWVQDEFFQLQPSDWTEGVPAFVIPAGQPVRLHVLWTIPLFGQVVIDLDGGGEGYTTTGAGDCLVLNFGREAARSEIVRLRREAALFEDRGYTIEAAAAAELAGAEEALAAGRCEEAIAHALTGQEELYLGQARADIPRFRQGQVLVTVRGDQGEPLAGTPVSYKQVTHAFQFGGSYLTDGWNYLPEVGDRLAEAGFNASSVCLTYKILEPAPAGYDFGYLDRQSGLQAMLDKGFQVHGELAYWANDSPFWEDRMCPSYWRAMSFDQVKANIRDHFRALAAQYGDRIGPWMINEQNLPWSNGLDLTWSEKLEVFQAVAEGLESGCPGAENIVCSVAMPYSWGQEEFPGESAVAGGIGFPDYLDLLLDHGLPVDSIGLEFYHFGYTSDSYGPPGASLATMGRLLDLYDAYGLPVYVKEFQVPSSQEAGSSWWRHPWDESTQAEFATRFYTLAFSRPHAAGIQWSAFVSDRNTYVINAGILDVDYQPKPVYFALKDLIASWTTSGAGVTDELGRIAIQGFAGDYIVYVKDGALTVPCRVRVAEQLETEATVTARLTITLRVGDPYLDVGAERRPIDAQGSAPIVRDGRALVPVRVVAEALGGSATFDGTAGKVTVSLGGAVLELWLGRATARLNGRDVAIDLSNPALTPLLRQGRVYLPLRFVAESLGCGVGYSDGVITLTPAG
jgi:hypothetical protein